MATGDPCKSCRKDCVKNGGLPFNLIVKIGPDGCPIIDDYDFLSSIRALGNSLKILGCAQDCCLGSDIADHALIKVEEWFFYHLADLFAIDCQNGKWKDCIGKEVPIQLSNINIKVDITCNNDDVAQGKGPPHAKVSDDSSFDVNMGQCQSPDPGNGGGSGSGGGGNGMV